MDLDPELDVTLSDGRQSATFRITPVAGALEAWAILEPRSPLTVVVGRAGALATRSRLDTRIAERLATGWVPVDAGPMAALVPPTPVSPDLALQIGSLLEALDRARQALRAADPSGQLWAACHLFRRQAWRFGIGARRARVVRAQRERRLGELAEQVGDLPAALLHYRAALAAHPGVGVKRRLLRLAPPGVAPSSPAGPPPADSTGLVAARERSCVSEHPARPNTRRHSMTGRIQIVGRLPVALNRRVRAAAKRRKVSLNAFLIEALTHALGSRRIAEAKERR